MAERRNESVTEWLDINLMTLSADDHMQLIEEICDHLSVTDLRRMRDLAEQKRQEKLEDAKDAVLAEMREKFEELGLSLEDVFPSRRPRREGGTARVKYRSPDGKTWSGRGFLPNWLRELEDQGHNRDEFLVEQDGAGL